MNEPRDITDLYVYYIETWSGGFIELLKRGNDFTAQSYVKW